MTMLLLATCGPVLAATWTVDPAGAGDYLDIASAVAAAEPGDVLAVQPGTYDPVYLSDATLTIAAIAPGTVTLGGLVSGGGDVVVTGVQFVDAFEPVSVGSGRLTLSQVDIVGGGGDAAIRAVDGAE